MEYYQLFIDDILFIYIIHIGLSDKNVSIPSDQNVSTLLESNLNNRNIETYWYRKLCMKTCYTSNTFENFVNFFVINVHNLNIETFWHRKPFMTSSYNSKLFEYITNLSFMIFWTKIISIPSTYILLRLFDLLKLYGSSSHIKPARDNVRKYMGIKNCWTIAITSYRNCFQNAGVPFTDWAH